MNWKKYFELLVDWKKLPAYKAEPRVDSLLGFYLPSILESFLEVKIEGIIPEFPLRLATVKPELNDDKKMANRSYKVDFFAVGGDNKNYLVEFKTDNNSLSPKQDEYLRQASKKGTGKLIDGVIAITRASTSRKKYEHLNDKLKSLGLLNDLMIYSGKNPVLEVKYIIPAKDKDDKNIIDFKDIAEWLKLNGDKDPFETAFQETLEQWYNDFKQ